MVMLRPFRPLRYNPDVAGDLASVVAPPYDVISDAYRDQLYERSPLNVVRLILNRDEDRYASAARFLSEWKQRKVLVRDAEPAVCFYVEDFALPDGQRRQRAGVIAVVRIEALGSGVIRPHERTFSRAKEDRLRVLEACRTNLSPIFGLLPGQQQLLQPVRDAAERRAPEIDLKDDRDNRHRVWFVRDADVIAQLEAAVASEAVVIADGHHRYETALTYRNQLRERGESGENDGHNFILMYLTSIWDPGLVVLPTHRLLSGVPGFDSAGILRRLEEDFRLVRVDADAQDAFEREFGRQGEAPCIGVALQGSDHRFVAVLKDAARMDGAAAEIAPIVRALDVTVLDVLILQGVLGLSAREAVQAGQLSYTHSDDEALQAVAQGAQAAFLLRPPRMEDVLAVCGSGQTMPEKSTYFYPKLLSGLVFHPFD